MIHSGIAAPFFDARPKPSTRSAPGTASTVLSSCSSAPSSRARTSTCCWTPYEALPASVRQEFELVVAGPMGWASAETAARVRSVRGVRYLGYIPEPDIAPLTAAATVFAYPSLYEGFGFPVAQAMAAGTPVITSNVSSLPEITGDAALLIDPRSVGELRDGAEPAAALAHAARRTGGQGPGACPRVSLGGMRRAVPGLLSGGGGRVRRGPGAGGGGLGGSRRTRWRGEDRYSRTGQGGQPGDASVPGMWNS